MISQKESISYKRPTKPIRKGGPGKMRIKQKKRRPKKGCNSAEISNLRRIPKKQRLIRTRLDNLLYIFYILTWLVNSMKKIIARQYWSYS